MPHALPLRRGAASLAPTSAQAYDVPGTSNVLVVGGSYGGMHCAAVLAAQLPPSHRVILIERNSHFNHLYVFPRFSVFPSHEHKAFIPYRYLFKNAPKRADSPGRSRRAKARGSSSGSGSSKDSASTSTSGSAMSTAPSSVTNEWSEKVGEMAQGVPNVEARLGAEVQGRSSAAAQEEEGRDTLQLLELGETLEEEDAARTPPDAPAHGFEGSAPHLVLHATVTDITPTHVTVTASSEGTERKRLWSIADVSIPYTHLVYALGSHLPTPLRTEARTKTSGSAWLRSMQERIASARSIAIVGGGPLGVQLATDIGSRYTGADAKDVTLLHSRKRLLPNFDERLHDAAKERMDELGVHTVLGERLALSEGCPKGSSMDDATRSDALTPSDLSALAHPDLAGPKRLTTTAGRRLVADLVLLCNGQQPNSSLLARLSPSSVDPATRLVRVRRTLQVALPEVEQDEGEAQMPFVPRAPCGDCDCFANRKLAGGTESEGAVASGETLPPPLKHTRCLPNVYAIGDVADAFGALCAGYQAWAMADVAAGNIVKSISAESSSSSPALQPFEPAPALIKLTLGLGLNVTQGVDEKGNVIVTRAAEAEDLNVEAVWGMATAPTDDLFE